MFKWFWTVFSLGALFNVAKVPVEMMPIFLVHAGNLFIQEAQLKK